MKALSELKKKFKYFLSFLQKKEHLISVGGGCDIKLFLINKYFKHYPTEFFDYLWNLDKGLIYVKDIIKNDFVGIKKESDFIFTVHKKFQKNLITKIAKDQINLQSEDLGIQHYVSKNYPELNFMHYPKLDELIVSFNKKIKKFRNILKNRDVYFIYYRQFDEPVLSEYVNNSDYNLKTKIDFWIEESKDFVEFVKSINNKNKLLSLFALPYNFDRTLSDKYNIKEKSDDNLKLDFVYYKNAHSSDRTYVDAEMKRIYKKYLSHIN